MQTMLSPDITTWPADEPQLIGSRCVACTATVFPRQPYCPKCSAGTMEDLLLPREGTVIAWTTQGFPPGPPYKGETGAGFEPFGVGLVQLGDMIRVEGRLTENDPEKLQFGQRVELTIIALSVDEDGNELLTFAFRPVIGA